MREDTAADFGAGKLAHTGNKQNNISVIPHFIIYFLPNCGFIMTNIIKDILQLFSIIHFYSFKV